MTTTVDEIITVSERGQLTAMQVKRLLNAIDPKHVEQKRGMSYMAQHEVRAELTRIFGPGNWDSQVTEMTLIYETQMSKGDPGYPQKGDGKPYFVTCYRAAVQLRIRDYHGRPVAEFLEFHAEENAPLPNRGEAHAFAMTSVESYALRRAAIGLGDRLGLGLYAGGSLDPLVKGSLIQLDKESPIYVAPEEKPAEPAAEQKMPDEPSAAEEQRVTSTMDQAFGGGQQ